jgi:hypothetical protein
MEKTRDSGFRIRESILSGSARMPVRGDVQQKDGQWTATLESRRRVDHALKNVAQWSMARCCLACQAGYSLRHYLNG